MHCNFVMKIVIKKAFELPEILTIGLDISSATTITLQKRRARDKLK